MTIKEEIDNLKQTGIISPKAPYSVCIIFFKKCEVLKISPYTNDVLLVDRYDPVQGRVFMPLIGINGMRKIMKDTGEYTGSDAPTYNGGKNISEMENIFYPKECTVNVYRNKNKFSSSVAFSEYAPNPISGLWKTKPKVMIAKVAEAMAARKGFPELNGFYLDEEIAQMDKIQDHSYKKNFMLINKSIDDLNNKLEKG